MYKIGEFSLLNKVTIKTLRYYEKEGLLIPAFVDRETGYRFYETSQLPELAKIVSLRQMGLSINNIKSFLIGVSSETIKFEKLNPVKAACIYHKGAYDNLRESYSFLLKWVEENGYEIAEPIRERYIDGMWNKESEDEWLTEIQIPIREK